MFARIIHGMSFFEKVFGFPEGSYQGTQFRLASVLKWEQDPLQKNIAESAHWERSFFDFGSSASASASAAGGKNNNNNNESNNSDASSSATTTSSSASSPSVPPLHNGTFVFDDVAQLRKVALKMLQESKYTHVGFDKHHIVGDSRKLHSDYPGALFQAASQFNCLEFVGPSVTPEKGITVVAQDFTQGPSCCLPAAQGLAFRNYICPTTEDGLLGKLSPEVNSNNNAFPTEKFVTEAAKLGQTAYKQLNGLSSLEKYLFTDQNEQKKPIAQHPWWKVKNGYIELTNEGEAAKDHFAQVMADASSPFAEQKLIDLIRVGCVFDTEVSDKRLKHIAAGLDLSLYKPALCSQVYASACSIGYSRRSTEAWSPLAMIVLKSAYEATFYAYVIHALRCEKENRPYEPLVLTKIGGGCFANPSSFIEGAMIHAQDRTVSLFDEVRKTSGDRKEANSSNAFKFTCWLTHYSHIEDGYEKFLKH